MMFAGAVERAVVEPSRDIESLPPDGDLRRGRNSPFEAREAGKHPVKGRLGKCGWVV